MLNSPPTPLVNCTVPVSFPVPQLIGTANLFEAVMSI